LIGGFARILNALVDVVFMIAVVLSIRAIGYLDISLDLAFFVAR
jgi:hypothetical protein